MAVNENVLIPAAGIVREAFYDEVIIINLDSGTYYSLNGTGVAVWTMIEGGASLETIVAAVAARYAAETTTVETDIRQLVQSLLAEQLVRQGEVSAAGTPPTVAPDREKLSYEPPQLSVFTDMQELLRLDPVHDVDETGWPHRPKSDSEE